MNWKVQDSRRGQLGGGRLKAIIYFGILIFGVFAAFKIVPPYVNDYQLKDKMSEQARFAVVNRYTPDQIRDNIYRTIQDLDIPAQKDDVKVENTNHGIMISVDYTVPIDLVVYKTDLKFSTSSEGRDLLK